MGPPNKYFLCFGLIISYFFQGAGPVTTGGLGVCFGGFGSFTVVSVFGGAGANVGSGFGSVFGSEEVVVVFVLTFTFLPLLLIVYSPSVSVDGFVSEGSVGSFTGLGFNLFIISGVRSGPAYHKH